MLSILRPKTHRSISPLWSRSLNTLPDPIPRYVSVWDPTCYIPPHIDAAAEGRYGVHSDDVKRAENKAARRAAREAGRVAIRGTSNIYFDRLYRYLSISSADKDAANVRGPLWAAYRKAKRRYPKLPSLLSPSAWDVLWASQDTPGRQKRHSLRREYLGEILRDMHVASKAEPVQRRVDNLESLFASGDEEQALQEWETDHIASSVFGHAHKPEHLEAGVRMHAFVGNVQRAEVIMDELFELYPAWNPACMMAVFRCHTRFSENSHHKQAYELYLRMKSLLGKDATLRDYDSWYVGFLEGRNLQYAKNVFRDMVKGGYIAEGYSEEQVTQTLKRLYFLTRLGDNFEKTTSIALFVTSVLPRAYWPYLFGTWLKFGAVQHAPEASAQILDLMFKRDIEPQTFHFNVLLRVLLRTKKKEHEEKAENLGWRMVEEYDKAPSEGEHTSVVHTLIEAGTVDATLKAVKGRRIPPSDITTYALLLRHHANHGQWDHVDYLTKRLGESGITPNDEVMNVLMANLTRQGKYEETWKLYGDLTNPTDDKTGVFPNGASFRCLWTTLRLALGNTLIQDSEGLPTPRQLLAENIQWWTLVKQRCDAERFRMGLAAKDHGAVNLLMMHCFSYIKDLPGSLVAIHALRRHFDIFPSNNAAQIIQKQLAWIDLHREAESVRTHFHRTGIHTRNLQKMARVYHVLMQNRFERMGLTEETFAELSEEEMADSNLNLLSEYIRVVLKRQYSPGQVEALIDQAKRDIGVPDISTGDMDAFQVS